MSPSRQSYLKHLLLWKGGVIHGIQIGQTGEHAHKTLETSVGKRERSGTEEVERNTQRRG